MLKKNFHGGANVANVGLWNFKVQRQMVVLGVCVEVERDLGSAFVFDFNATRGSPRQLIWVRLTGSVRKKYYDMDVYI